MSQGFLAPIGEKITNVPITVRYAKFTPGGWNGRWNASSSMFIIAETDEGQTLKISGSGQSLYHLERGDQTVILSAKVKDHGEYRGTDQTILSHVKVDEAATNAARKPEPALVGVAYSKDELALRFMGGPPIEVPPRPDPDATTTLAKFAGVQRRNYESLPTIDVEILPDVHHCRECDELIECNPQAGQYGLGQWKHKDPNAPDHGYVSPKTRCRYCHAEAPIAVYRQHAWHDAVECSRCGGDDGHGIGD